MIGAGEWAAIEQLVDRLRNRYPSVPPEIVVTIVHRNHADFDGRPVRGFVPLLVERRAQRDLALLGV